MVPAEIGRLRKCGSGKRWHLTLENSTWPLGITGQELTGPWVLGLESRGLSGWKHSYPPLDEAPKPWVWLQQVSIAANLSGLLERQRRQAEEPSSETVQLTGGQEEERLPAQTPRASSQRWRVSQGSVGF